MVDASDAARFHEARKLLFDAAGHDYVRGKPLLVVANKQDCMQAVSAQEVAEALRIHDVGGSAQGAVNTRSCHVTTASLQDSCTISSGSTLDAGLSWLVGRIQAEYIELQSRVSQDEAEQHAREQKKREERQARVAAKRKAREEAEAAAHAAANVSADNVSADATTTQCQ